MNDTIKTEEDVEKYLGLTVLASVPDADENKNVEKKGTSRKKNSKKGEV